MSLGEELPKEIKRVLKIRDNCLLMGPSGHPLAAMILYEIGKAERAMIEGDTVAMIQSYQALKEFSQ